MLLVPRHLRHRTGGAVTRDARPVSAVVVRLAVLIDREEVRMILDHACLVVEVSGLVVPVADEREMNRAARCSVHILLADERSRTTTLALWRRWAFVAAAARGTPTVGRGRRACVALRVRGRREATLPGRERGPVLVFPDVVIAIAARRTTPGRSSDLRCKLLDFRTSVEIT